MSSTEVAITATLHGSIALVGGNLVDSVFPPYVAGRSDARLFFETLGQFVLGYMGLAELMRLIIPGTAGYTVPIGDGLSNVAFYSAQPQLRLKLEDLLGRMDTKLRDSLGLAPQQRSGGAKTPQ